MPVAASVPHLLKDAEDKMKKALAAALRQLAEVRGGRATPSLVEHVTVAYYGTPTPLKQLAAITAPDPRLLVVQPWDASLVQEIEKAILQSGLGITPSIDGKLLRLPIPTLSSERRAELTRLVHKMAEEGRVAVRNIRRDANEAVKDLKTKKLISEDDAFKAQHDIQKLTDTHIEDVNKALAAKEHELQTV